MFLRVLLQRLLALFQKRKLEHELDDEIKSHLEILVEDNVRRGMSLEEARYAAHRSFRGVDQIKESYRDRRGSVDRNGRTQVRVDVSFNAR